MEVEVWALWEIDKHFINTENSSAISKHMLKSPLFSIVIPAYNCAQYIQQTLRSIYNQTERNYEIIIINDGSTDNLLELLAQETDPRLRVITQENGGVSRARNRGVEEAQGTYIAFLDGDDIWLPFHLEKAKTFFEKYPEFHWYATKLIFKTEIKDSDFKDAEAAEATYYSTNWFLDLAPEPISQTVVIKKESAKQYLHFPIGIKMFEDNVAWSRFAIHTGSIGTLNQPTAIYRQRAGSATQQFKELWERNTAGAGLDALLEQQKLLKEPNCPKEAKLYFKKRSLLNWMGHLSFTNTKPWIQEIRQRAELTGKLNSCMLRLYAWGVWVCTKVVYKILNKQARSIQRELDSMLKTARQELK